MKDLHLVAQINDNENQPRLRFNTTTEQDKTQTVHFVIKGTREIKLDLIFN